MQIILCKLNLHKNYVANCYFCGFLCLWDSLKGPKFSWKTLLEPLCCVRIGKEPPLTLVFMEQCVWNLSCFLSWELCTWPLSFSLGGHSLIFSLSCLCCLCLIHLTISSLFFLSLIAFSLFSFSAVCENVCLCVRLSIFFFHSDLFLFALLLLVDVCSICSGELNSSQWITLNHIVHLYIPWYKSDVMFKGALRYFPL